VTRAEDTRARILHGAEEVVLRDGVAHLTLEAAASEAGISKGGILYHFPTRAALVTAMVERLGSQFDEDLEREDAGRVCPAPSRGRTSRRASGRPTTPLGVANAASGQR